MTTKILCADTDYDLKLITEKIKNTETTANILQNIIQNLIMITWLAIDIKLGADLKTFLQD